MKLKSNFLLYFAYALEILVLYVLQDTPNLMPEIFGSRPLLLIPIALTAAAKENQIPSLVIGAVCGALTDISTNGSLGYFAILLTLVCYFESLLLKTYFVSSFRLVMLVSAAAVTALICLYFFILVLESRISDYSALFINHYISRIIYTLAFVVPLFFLNGFLHKKLHR